MNAVYIVTGASKGIGLGIRKALLAKSETVLSIGRWSEAELDSGSERDFRLRLDLADSDSNPTAAIEWIQKNQVQVKGLVNNAGLLLNASAETLSADDFRRMWEVNVMGAFQLTQGLLPFFTPTAHILNIGSMGGFQGSRKYAGLSGYSATKAALANLTECWAEEWANRGIRVNCLALGAVQTDMLAHAFPFYTAPLTATEMGGYIAQFLMEGHRFYNGQVLPVTLQNPG